MAKDIHGALILVVHDVEETRDAIEKLLRAEGYHVHCARQEEDGVATANRYPPELILLNLGGRITDVIACARRIRQRAGLADAVPVLIFCVGAVDPGKVVDIGDNVFMTRPDNFEQLKNFLGRLLQ